MPSQPVEQPTSSVQRNFLMPIELADWLRKRAFDSRRTQAELVREALQEYRERVDVQESDRDDDSRRAALIRRFASGAGVDLAILRDHDAHMSELD
jgi:hypothetical protein